MTLTAQRLRPAGSGTSQSRRASAVALYVYERAEVELTITETLRLSRLAHTPSDGFFLERHGELLPPGCHRLALATGVYHFKSVNDVHVRLLQPEKIQVVTPQGPMDLDADQGGSR
ncbi:MAG TPA: hypothetical protein VF163_09055 [Micromonosporaceae bacterium]